MPEQEEAELSSAVEAKKSDLHASPLKDCPLFQQCASKEGNYFSLKGAVNLLSTW